MRQTENKKLIDSLPKEIKGTTEQQTLILQSIQAKALLDISRSLAIIADTSKAERKAIKETGRRNNDKSKND